GDIVITQRIREVEEPYGYVGLPEITSEIIIEGNGWTIGREQPLDWNYRTFTVTPTGNLTLHRVTVKSGFASSVASCTFVYACGGGLLIYYGSATILESTFIENRASFGAGIYVSHGTLVVSNSVFTQNGSSGTGAAITNTFGTITIADTLMDSNIAYARGGGISNTGTATITDVTISN